MGKIKNTTLIEPKRRNLMKETLFYIAIILFFACILFEKIQAYRQEKATLDLLEIIGGALVILGGCLIVISNYFE